MANIRTRGIAIAGAVAALYVILTIVIAPLSYGPIQIRFANMLKPLALFNPYAIPAFVLGTAMANIASPFGPWDYLVMPLVDGVAALVVWKLRRYPWVAVFIQCVIISAGVSLFPLWLGGGISPIATVAPVMLGQVISILGGYALIWRRREDIVGAARIHEGRQTL